MASDGDRVRQWGGGASEIFLEGVVPEDRADAADLLVDGVAGAAEEGGDVALGDGSGEEEAELALERGEAFKGAQEVEEEAGIGGVGAGEAGGVERVEEGEAGVVGVERGVEGDGEEVGAALLGELAAGEVGEVVREDARHIGPAGGAAATAVRPVPSVPVSEAAAEEEFEVVAAEAGAPAEVGTHGASGYDELPFAEQSAPGVGHRSGPCFFRAPDGRLPDDRGMAGAETSRTGHGLDGRQGRLGRGGRGSANLGGPHAEPPPRGGGRRRRLRRRPTLCEGRA